MNSCSWIHDYEIIYELIYEFIYEFSAIKKIVISWLNSYK